MDGFNKYDAWAAGLGLLTAIAGIAGGLGVQYFQNKATNTRIDQQNARLEPSLRQPPIQK